VGPNGSFFMLRVRFSSWTERLTNSTNTTHLLFVGLGTACTLKHANNLTVTTP